MSGTQSSPDPLERLEQRLAALPAAAPLGLFTHLAAAEARRDAAESARRIARGTTRGPLEGRTVVLKGNIAVRGWPWQGGLRARQGEVAADDAPVVQRLRAAGAVLLAQTTQDEGALGAEGLALEGPIRHPGDPARSTGGSSGGSAGALAAGLCDLALGTDTIGSVRIPAALCGIAALKPSYGRVSVRGVLPVHPRFDHVGPMARGIADLRALLAVIAGHDAASALSVDYDDADTAIHAGLDSASGGRQSPLAGRRIGYAIGFDDLAPEAAVIDGYNASLEALRAAGATLVPVDVRPLGLRRARRAVFALCEHEMWRRHRDDIAARPEAWSGRIRPLLDYGASLDPGKLRELDSRVTAFQFAWQDLVGGLDACVSPTTPGTAFPHDAPAPDSLADLTVIGTAAAVPAASVPCPAPAQTAADGRAPPTGLQVLAPRGHDARALSVAAVVEAAAALPRTVPR
jgi:aspartyl-tRNA(Asn)/glutamyl-tRNA(Gln) amidotransferase subunit A